jgi:hypothetical protein
MCRRARSGTARILPLRREQQAWASLVKTPLKRSDLSDHCDAGPVVGHGDHAFGPVAVRGQAHAGTAAKSLARDFPASIMTSKLSRSNAELRDAWTDLAHFKAAVDLAKKDLAAAQLQLVEARAALADAMRLTRLSSWLGLLPREQRRARADKD